MMQKQSSYKNRLKRIGQLLLVPFLSICLFQSYFLIFLAPIPLVYGQFRYGRTLGFLLIMTSFLLVSLFESNVSILIFLLAVVLVAFVFSEVSKKKKSIETIMIRSVVTLFCCYLAILLFVSKGHPYSFLHNIGTQYLNSLPQMIEKAQPSLSFWKVNPEQLSQWKEQIQNIAQKADLIISTFIQERLIAYLISALLLMFWVTIVVLKNMHVSVTQNDLTKWKAPDYLVWAVIASFFLSDVMTLPIVTPVAKNILAVLIVIYFLQGISIAAFYFANKKYLPAQKFLGYLCLGLFPFLTTCIGFFDLWINFRGYIGRQNKKPVLKLK